MRKDTTSGGSAMLDIKPSNARILVVDADMSTASTLGAVLRHDGWTVRVASGGEEALNALAEGQFDLLLADLDDNDRRSQETLRQAQLAVPAVTVVVMTGYATLESALRALRRGVYDYLTKPIDVEELRITLARALEQRRLRHELAARVRELEVAHAAARDFNTRLQ
jgi:two-component system response regulator HydG